VVIQRVRHRLIYSKHPETEINGVVKDLFKYERLSSMDSVSSQTSFSSNDSSLNDFIADPLSREEECQLIQYAVDAICLDKSIKSSIHKEFVNSLRVSLSQMFRYKQVIEEAVDLSKTRVDKECKEHSLLLLELWNSLQPDCQLKAVEDCPDWTLIGFQQSKDPCTDFRGMGLLGLKHLVFLSKNHKSTAHSMLSTSSHPIKGYPFAITGINMSHLVLSLMKDKTLTNYFYNIDPTKKLFSVSDLDKVYAAVFIAFNRYWIQENPQDLMEFSVIREKFVNSLKDDLNQEPTNLLKWSCPIVDVI
jgi:hypothetical protein